MLGAPGRRWRAPVATVLSATLRDRWSPDVPRAEQMEAEDETERHDGEERQLDDTSRRNHEW
jgi:hypothetical protein